MSKKTLKIRAKLGKASIGKETASLGFKVSRSILNLENAEHFFCGARLAVTIYEDPDPDQKKFPGMEGPKLNGVVDVKRFSCSPEFIGGTLSFCESEVERHDVADFGQLVVAMIAERTGNAAEIGGEDGDESDE